MAASGRRALGGGAPISGHLLASPPACASMGKEFSSLQHGGVGTGEGDAELRQGPSSYGLQCTGKILSGAAAKPQAAILSTLSWE